MQREFWVRWNVAVRVVGVDVLIDPTARRRKKSLPLVPKGSPWMLHRLRPPLEGRWRAQRDGEVL